MPTVQQLEEGITRAKTAGNLADVQALEAALNAIPTASRLSAGYYHALDAGNQADADALASYAKAHGIDLVSRDLAERGASFRHYAGEHNIDLTPTTSLPDVTAMQKEVQDESLPMQVLHGIYASERKTLHGINQALGNTTPEGETSARYMHHALTSTPAAKAGNFVGDVGQYTLGGGAIGAGLKTAGVSAKLVPLLASVLSSGALSGAQPADTLGQRFTNAGEGAALGAAGELAPRFIGALAKRTLPKLSKAKEYALAVARANDIPVHAAQISNGRGLKLIASALNRLPLTGAAKAQDAQDAAFNRALSRVIGQDADELTPEVINAADRAKGAGYNALFERNPATLTRADVIDMKKLVDAARAEAGDDAANAVKRQAAKLLSEVEPNGSLPGRKYQAFRTGSLRRAMQTAQTDPATQYWLKQFQKLADTVTRRNMSDTDMAELRRLDQLHNNIRTLQRGLDSRVAGAGYRIKPAQLYGLKSRKYGFTPQMDALARMGQNLLKDPIPNSGTAERYLMYKLGLEGAAGLLHPQIAVPLAAMTVLGRALNSQAAARVLPGAGAKMLDALSGAARAASPVLPALSPALQ